MNSKILNSACRLGWRAFSRSVWASFLILGIACAHAFAESVNLRWDPNPEPEVIGYRVYRGTSPGQYDWMTEVGITPQLTVSELFPGVTYYFVVTAWNDGGMESGPSNEVSYRVPGEITAPLSASDALVETSEDAELDVLLSATGAEGRALVYTIVTPPALGSLSGTPPALRYQPNANASGEDQVQYVVTDGFRVSSIATIRIRVLPVNDAPQAISRSVNVVEDTPTPITLMGTDPEGSPLTYTVTRGPQSGSLTGTGATLTYQPRLNFFGRDSIEFRVSDGSLLSAVATVTINVSAVNDRPVAGSRSVTVVEDGSVSAVLTASDPDSSRLTFVVTRGPARGTLTGVPPSLVYTPAPNFFGSDSFEFTANDGQLTSAPGVISFVVTPVDDPPAAFPGNWTVTEDTMRSLVLAGQDLDGDGLLFQISVMPSHGSLFGVGSNWVYRPKLNYSGPDRFEFTCTDGIRTTASTPVTLQISAVNDAPVAYSQSIATSYGVVVPVTLRGVDVEGSPLTYRIVANPLRGTLSGTAPAVVYTPLPGSTGDDSFSFVVNDGVLDSKVATVRFRVSLSLVSLRSPGTVVSGSGLGDGLVAAASSGDALLVGSVDETVAPSDAGTLQGPPEALEFLEPPQHGIVEHDSSGVVRYDSAADGATLDVFSYAPLVGGVRGEPVHVTVHSVGVQRMGRVNRTGIVVVPTIPGPMYTAEVNDSAVAPEETWISVGTQTSSEAGQVEWGIGEPPLNGVRLVRIRCVDGGTGASVLSEAWGIHSLRVPADLSENVFSLPLQGPICVRAGVSRVEGSWIGLSRELLETVRVDSVTGNPTHILVLRSSQGRGNDGEWWPILEQGAGAVRLETRGESLEERLRLGDAVEVHRLLTVADVFGRAGTSEMQLNGGDRLELEAADGTFYLLDYRLSNRGPGTYWVGRGGAVWGGLDGEGLPLLPAQVFTFLRRMRDGEILVVGRVADGPAIHYLRSGDRYVGNAFPAPAGIVELQPFIPVVTGGSLAPESGGLPEVLGAARGLRVQIPASVVMQRWLQPRPW